MSPDPIGRPIDILLVEDNPGDVRLTQELLKESKVRNSPLLTATSELRTLSS